MVGERHYHVIRLYVCFPASGLRHRLSLKELNRLWLVTSKLAQCVLAILEITASLNQLFLDGNPDNPSLILPRTDF